MSAHGTLVNAVIQLIDARGGFAWKSASGVLPVGKRFVHTGMRGLPDVCAVWPPLGRLICVECKTGTGRLSRAQVAVHAKLRERGVLVIVARSILDVEKALT